MRRTPLTRKTPLRSKTTLRRARLRQKTIKAATRIPDTGPSQKVRDLVRDRSMGCCELCGHRLWAERWLAPHSIHHRRPRGMGGTSRVGTNLPANLLLVCGTGTTGCHGLIESNRVHAIAEGWLVGQGENPAEVPVTLRYGALRFQVFLDDEGGSQAVFE